jgi:hypothetical protein
MKTKEIIKTARNERLADFYPGGQHEMLFFSSSTLTGRIDFAIDLRRSSSMSNFSKGIKPKGNRMLSGSRSDSTC